MDNSFSAITLIFKIMGLQFFSFDSFSFQSGFRDKTEISKNHKISFALSFIPILLQIIGIFYTISLEKQVDQNKNVTAGLTVQFIAYGAIVVVILISRIHLFMNTDKAKQIFCNLEKISMIFVQDLNVKVNYTEFVRSFKLKMILINIVFFILTISTLGFIFYNDTFSRLQINIFIWAILAIYPYYFMTVLFIFLPFFALLI